MSDVDRESFRLFTLRALGTSMQRVRAYGELYSGVFLPGRADPDPSGSSRMSTPCGLVGAGKSLAESSGPRSSLQVLAQRDSHYAHHLGIASMM